MALYRSPEYNCSKQSVFLITDNWVANPSILLYKPYDKFGINCQKQIQVTELKLNFYFKQQLLRPSS
jgi:hypothetical protein